MLMWGRMRRHKNSDMSNDELLWDVWYMPCMLEEVYGFVPNR